jgi:multiple sugar transport system ATP-binding protein
MANITLKNISAGAMKSGLDLTIPDRDFVVLTGSPESSTIVRLMAGLEEVSNGEILFDGRPVNDVAPKDRDVAFVAHDYTPYPNQSVFENLAVGLRRRKFADTEIRKRIAAVAGIFHLEAQLEKNAESLSAEQRRLVGLARAMVRQPKVYLFDEPFAGLDPAAARRGRAEIVKLHQRSSATIVFATSNPAEALALGQRTVVLIDGAVQQDGPAQMIYDVPLNLAVARFFGEPPMNLVTGTLNQDRGALVFSEAGDGTISVPLPPAQFAAANAFAGKPVVLGFRPEDIEIDPAATAGKPADGSFRALVERAEMNGSGAQLNLQTGAHALVATSARWGPQGEGGRRVHVKITMEKAHLFEAETGGRITREP